MKIKTKDTKLFIASETVKAPSMSAIDSYGEQNQTSLP